MNKLLVIFLSLSFLLVLDGQTKTSIYAQDDCQPEAVGEWLVQRQIGRNLVQPIIDGPNDLSIIDSILLIQEVRRNLEDLPRPTCADELYQLTIYLYDNLVDFLTFSLDNDRELAVEIIYPRLEIYGEEVEPLFNELQEIAGIDVDAAVADFQPTPTSEPTATAVPHFDPQTLTSSSSTEVFGPFTLTAGFYELEYQLINPETSFRLAVNWEVGGDYFFTYTVPVGRQVYYFNDVTTFANVEVSGAKEWRLTLSRIEEQTSSSDFSASGVDSEINAIGPLYLEAGLYILEYQVANNASDFVFTGIETSWEMSNQEFLDSLLISEDSDLTGRKIFSLEGGIYFLNYSIVSTNDWEITISPSQQ
ncbi:MAG: hypothetical protein K8L91_25190 [Anaerolineae bacterium]|nr:hypothetical protein [Anaerolineae bacterium]